MDIRHKKRVEIVQELYSSKFDKKQIKIPKAKKIIQKVRLLDRQIHQGAPKYETERIANVDLSILRLAVYELMVEKSQPPKVIINEAINLAHELGGEKSPAFVNAVLGYIYKQLTPIESGLTTET